MQKGFTLIELLIVVTIIAILAGAAIPYVSDYIDQAKVARAKEDLTEIRNALARWELDGRVWSGTSIAPLVGPYLSKLLIDPWGSPYYVDDDRSHVRSFGPDGVDNAGANDDLVLAFRPPMACTRVEYLDTDGSGSITASDTYGFYFTRPASTTFGNLGAVTIGGVQLSAIQASHTMSTNGRVVRFYVASPTPTISGNIVSINGGVIGNGFADRDASASSKVESWVKPATLTLQVGGI